MAPEVIKTSTFSKASDVWRLVWKLSCTIMLTYCLWIALQVGERQ
jgi:hypothetical protein